MPNHYAVHSLNKSIPKLFKPSVFQELSTLKVLTLRSLSFEGNTRKMYIKKNENLPRQTLQRHKIRVSLARLHLNIKKFQNTKWNFYLRYFVAPQRQRTCHLVLHSAFW